MDSVWGTRIRKIGQDSIQFEEFLAGSRFEQRRKLDELPIDHFNLVNSLK